MLSNQFSYKTLRKSVFASKPQNSLRIVESTSKTDQSTPNEPNAHVPVNQPKQSTLLNKMTRETSRKHVLTSKPKTALRIIESTLKTDRTTPNEPNARILANEPKQSNLLNETTRKTSRKHVFPSKPKTALRIIESTPKTDRSTPNESKARETANEPKQRASRNQTTRQTVSTNALDCEHFECEEVKFTDFVLVFRTHAGENSHRYGDRKDPLDACNGTGKYHPPMELDELYPTTP